MRTGVAIIGSGPAGLLLGHLLRAEGIETTIVERQSGGHVTARVRAGVADDLHHLLGTARVAMSDTMFRQNANLAEVRGVVGHEMGHYARGHIWMSAAVLGLLAVVMLFVTDRVYPLAARAMRANPAGGIADPSALPVPVVILSTLILLATPVSNTLTRLQESDADRFSLKVAHEPDGLSKALVNTIAYRASSPGAVEEAIFYDHPGVERRVRRAMVGKAEHPELVGR